MRIIPCIIIPVLTALFLSVSGFAGQDAAAPAIVEAPSTCSSPRKSRVDTVVIHYTSAVKVDAARWDDPQLNLRIFRQYRVSAHYLIDRAGTVYRLVDERSAAWHAGGSIMPAPDNRKKVNDFSIGIELIATERSGFTEAQYASLGWLLADICTRHAIRSVLGHDEVSGPRAVQLGLRRESKSDPGPLFDWSRVR